MSSHFISRIELQVWKTSHLLLFPWIPGLLYCHNKCLFPLFSFPFFYVVNREFKKILLFLYKCGMVDIFGAQMSVDREIFLLYILKKMSCDFCACEISNVFVVSNEEESWYIFCLVEFLLCSQWLKLCFPLLKCTATLFVWKPFVRILSCYGR